MPRNGAPKTPQKTFPVVSIPLRTPRCALWVAAVTCWPRLVFAALRRAKSALGAVGCLARTGRDELDDLAHELGRERRSLEQRAMHQRSYERGEHHLR